MRKYLTKFIAAYNAIRVKLVPVEEVQRAIDAERERCARVVRDRADKQSELTKPEDWPEGAWNARQVGIIAALDLAAAAIRGQDQ